MGPGGPHPRRHRRGLGHALLSAPGIALRRASRGPFVSSLARPPRSHHTPTRYLKRLREIRLVIMVVWRDESGIELRPTVLALKEWGDLHLKLRIIGGTNAVVGTPW